MPATITVQAAVEQLDLLDGDPAAKRAFLDTLPDAVFNDVKLVLQERKKAKDAAKKQRAAEIEDLL
jgi:recombinational DNA repair ATPase RecF